MVNFSEEKERLICRFSGRLDGADCAGWEDDLFKRIENAAAPVVFDLKEVDYVASGFLRICLLVSKRTDPESFLIINTRPYVKKIFKVSQLDKRLNVR